jgi:acetylornithine deacetylase/succinyl-diaminopimelate desuccinylase-like protein
MTAWQSYLDEQQPAFLEQLIDFLKIPSVSSLSEHADDVRKAGQWVSDKLTSIGMENVQMLETGGHPVVYADWLHAEGAPTVLIYGHFDTQPYDPIELWDNPPFEPLVKDGRIYARGASDDKGGMFIPVLALEALLKSEGGLPVNVKCLFEGQEEIGSPQLPDLIQKHKDMLNCDMLFSSDGAQWGEDQPAIILGTKGMCGLQINVTGANSDLHSGVYGGAVANPLHSLVRILDSMRAPDGKITVDGFFDDVRDLTDADREQFKKVPYDEADYKAQIGVDELFGEPGYTTYERAWARPTLEVNGIYGGFQGEGTKTVLPNSAHAKITCRLVANQDPQKILECLEAHIKAHTPTGVRVEVQLGGSTADPFLMEADHPGNQAAASVLKEVFDKEPYYIRIGGSLPICGLFQKHLGVDMVNFAFGLMDENIHAPNEFFRLKNFERGQRAYCMLLHRLANPAQG